MREFQATLNKAAKAAAKRGEISEQDVRRIQRARFRPFVMIALRRRVIDEAVLCGVLKPAAAAVPEEIDWDEFLAFLRELLPMILEFIQVIMVLF